MALVASEVIPSKKSAVITTSVDSAWKDLARCTRSTKCSSYFTSSVFNKGLHQRVFVNQGIYKPKLTVTDAAKHGEYDIRG
jgi:hypothetical protein